MKSPRTNFRQNKRKSFFSTAIISERFDVSSLLVFHIFAFFSFFTRSQLFATQRVNRAQHSMSELKSEDKSGSCDKWRTHVPSLYVYYLCPPRRSTSSLENVLSVVLTYILYRDHLHTFVRVNLSRRQFVCPKILIILWPLLVPFAQILCN